MFKLRKTTPTEPLIVSMTGLRLGDRVLFQGASDAKGIALLALKTGLTGRACVVDDDARRLERAAEAALREGALLETTNAPVTTMPFEADSFDVVVVSRLLPELSPARRSAALQEAARVLRPAGRCIVIQPSQPRGIAALLGQGNRMAVEEIHSVLSSANFRGVRTLADRSGLVFVEAARR